MTNRTPQSSFFSAFTFTLLFTTGLFASGPFSSDLAAQGMPLDSVLGRISGELNNSSLAPQLETILSNYADQRVWGLSTGDFTNDSLPDLALSLYDMSLRKNQVRVIFLRNNKGKTLENIFERVYPYVESPIEIGLSIEGSVVTVVQKMGDQHWVQQGYTDFAGDVILIDRFVTEREELKGPKNRSLGHEVYANFENLRSRESYFTGASGEPLFTTKYLTFPAYQRLRDVYAGYGQIAADTTKDFIVDGLGMRKDSRDLSIARAMSAYDDEFLYFSITVSDDYVAGNPDKETASDRVSLWFDTQFREDRRVLSKQGGFPTFRDQLDSTIYNLTFVLPSAPGKLSKVLYSAERPLTPLQQEALREVKAQMAYDTLNGIVTGYTVRTKIPFAFFGFETNPLQDLDIRRPSSNGNGGSSETPYGEEHLSMGFTALVYDIDDPSRPQEATIQATSQYKKSDPSSFGTLIFEPQGSFYGEVYPTYMNTLRQELQTAGY